MKRCLPIIVILAITFPLINLRAQFYITGQPPASVQWKTIRTDHFKLVFPEAITQDAGRLANILEYYHPLTTGELGQNMMKPFPVLINSMSVLSNGYVAVAPRRMEIVATPPQNSYAQDWLSQLALHEYRHVVQLNKLNQGFTKVSGWVTGQIAQGIVSAQVPAWFFEGDAVYNETLHSGAGRGRIPGFDMGLRTLLMQNPKPYSYNKAIFGSYRNFVPDHYQYGYHMVRYAREKFGNSVWSDALNFTARNPFLVWPLALHLKKNFGIFNSGLYKLTVDSLKNEYNNQLETFIYSDYDRRIKRKDKVYTNYILANDCGNGNLVAIKRGLSEAGSFVIIDSVGQEKKLASVNTGSWQSADVFEKCLIWDETETDPRWQKRNYSVIKMMDISRGKERYLTRKSRYFSPDFSPGGTKIAVAETDNSNDNFLTVIDAGNGKIINRIPTGERQVVMPEWASDTEIIFISVTRSGKQIESFDLQKGLWKVYLPFTLMDIAEPANFGNYILFRASFHQVENIYAISKIVKGNIFRVTTSVTGAWHPEITRDQRELLFSEYTQNGFDIVKIPLDTSLWVKTSNFYPAEITGAPSYTPDSMPAINYKVTDYHKAGHLFNFHSWLPFYTDMESVRDNPENIYIKPGFIFLSQNLLSTVISSISYSFDRGYHYIHPSVQWRAWYPVVELSADFGGPQQTIPLPEGVSLPDNTFPHHDVKIRTYIPLLYQRGNHTAFLQPGIEYQRSAAWYYESGLKRGIDLVHFKVNTGRFNRMAYRDLYPRWGQSMAVTFTISPAEKALFGNLFSFQMNAFFPGILRHHHFFLRGGFQKQNTGTYFLSINRIAFPRGYLSAVSREFTGINLNYSFPFGYPDLSAGALLYLKRMRANLFYDIGHGIDIRENRTEGDILFSGIYRSYGAEIMADLHLIRLIFPLAAGVRVGYLPGREKFFSEFIMSISTDGF